MYDYLNLFPREQHIAIVSLREKEARFRSRTKFFDATDPNLKTEIANEVAESQRAGCIDHYISLGTFAPDKEDRYVRTADNARFFRSLFVDIDCHGGENDYASLREAEDALIDAVNTAGIPCTAIVNTGRGLQVFWAFSQDIAAARWNAITRDLYAVLVHLGLKVDMAPFGDRARVVRLPNTKHSKTSTIARVIFSKGPVWNYARLAQRLDDFADAHGVAPIPERQPGSRAANSQGSILVCRQNSLRTRELLKRVPSCFSTTPQTDGKYAPDSYARWRNTVWAIKQTGLPDAWDLAVEWAKGASGQYDDLYDSLERTWDSDKDDGCGVSAGTLVHYARLYAKAKDASFLRMFHWADADEAEAVGDDVVQFDTFDDDDEGMLRDESYFEALEYHSYGGSYDAAEAAKRAPKKTLRPRKDFPIGSKPGASTPKKTLRERKNFPIGSQPEIPAPKKTLRPRMDYSDPTNPKPLKVKVSRPRTTPKPVRDLTPLEEGAPPFVASKRYGGSRGEMPQGFFHNKGRPGFHIVKKMPGVDDDEIVMAENVSSCDVELVDTRVSYASGAPEYSHLFQGFSTTTGKPLPPVEMPGSLTNDSAGMARWFGHYFGQPFGIAKGGAEHMSRYFKSLIDMRLGDGDATETIDQAGWQGENGKGPFALGGRVIDEKGREYMGVVSHDAQRNLTGLGKQLGSAEIQRDLLNNYAQGENTCGQAIIALVAGSVLSSFVPHKGGIVYTYGAGTGTGKSTTHRIALGLFGHPRDLVCPGTTTSAARQIMQVARRDFTVYVDDYASGMSNNMNDVRNRTIREDFLQSTACQEKVRASQSGKTRTTGDRGWNAPLMLTINKRPEMIFEDNGGDTVAIYARMLVIHWQATRFERSKFPASFQGASPEEVMMENYGHIGPMFISYVQQNKAHIKRRISELTKELSDARKDTGMQDPERFQNSMVVSALVVAEWFRDHLGLEWDFARLESYLRGLPAERTAESATLQSNDISAVWSDFLARYSGGAVKQPPKGTNAIMLDPNARSQDVTAIRIDEKKGHAFISQQALLKFIASRGASTQALFDFIGTSFGGSDSESVKRIMQVPVRIDLTKGVAGRLKRDLPCFAFPLQSVQDGLEAPAEIVGNNVVPLHSRSG